MGRLGALVVGKGTGTGAGTEVRGGSTSSGNTGSSPQAPSGAATSSARMTHTPSRGGLGRRTARSFMALPVAARPRPVGPIGSGVVIPESFPQPPPSIVNSRFHRALGQSAEQRRNIAVGQAEHVPQSDGLGQVRAEH